MEKLEMTRSTVAAVRARGGRVLRECPGRWLCITALVPLLLTYEEILSGVKGIMSDVKTVSVTVRRDQSNSSAPSSKEENLTFFNGSEYSESFYVISLQGVRNASAANSDRLDTFLGNWSDMCGRRKEERGIHFEVCPGVVQTHRGHGIAQSFVNCLNKSMVEGRDMAYFFEDDARLFDDSSFCDLRFRQSLYKNITDDLLLLLLGGHSGHLNDSAASARNGLVHLTISSGLYGVGVPRRNQRFLQNAFGKELKKNKPIDPDRSIYEDAKKEGKNIYAIDPLVVKHPAGYSNTWGHSRDALEERHIYKKKHVQKKDGNRFGFLSKLFRWT